MEPREFRDPDTDSRFKITCDDDLRLQRYAGPESGWLDVAPSRYALVLLRALCRRPASEFERVFVLAEEDAVFEVETA